MNVQEALETLLAQDVYHCDNYDDDARLLAPIIEKFGRAAYRAGFDDGKAVYEWISATNAPGGCPRCRTETTTTVHINSEQRERCGVTAGVAAMVEKP